MVVFCLRVLVFGQAPLQSADLGPILDVQCLISSVQNRIRIPQVVFYPIHALFFIVVNPFLSLCLILTSASTHTCPQPVIFCIRIRIRFLF